MHFSVQNVAESFLNLGNPSAEIREQANQLLFKFPSSPEAWGISKELLANQNRDLQFLGAQVLYLKIKDEFGNFDSAHKNEMKDLIFTTIFKDFRNLTNNSLKQLYASAAVIGLQMIGSQDWTTCIPDILFLSQDSNENLNAVLEIFSVLSKEIQSKKLSLTQEYIKEILKQSGSQVFQVLYHILTSNSYDEATVTKALRATSSWTQIGGIELINFPSLIETLITYTSKAELCYLAIEVLSEGIKYSEYPGEFVKESLDKKSVSLPDDARISLQKIIHLFHEIKSTNKDLSTLPAAYELNELAVNIATSFNLIILENVDYFKILIEILLLYTANKKRQISSNTFTYWSFLKFEMDSSTEVQQLLKTEHLLIISEVYFELFKLVTQNCQAKNINILTDRGAIQKSLHNVSPDTAENFDEDEDLDGDMGLQEYRTQAGDLLYSCCAVVNKLRGAEGLEALFSLMLPLLKPLDDQQRSNFEKKGVRNEYILNYEVLIFGAKVLVEYLNFLGPSDDPALASYQTFDKYIIEIVKNILQLPKEAILVRSSLIFLAECADRITCSIPEYADVILSFCLDAVSELNLVKTSSDCVPVLSKISADKIGWETLEKILKFIETSIFLIEDKNQNLIWISAIFYVSKFISNEQVIQTFLQKIFHSLQQKFEIFSELISQGKAKMEDQYHDAIKLFTTFANTLQAFKNEYQGGDPLPADIGEIITSFVYKNIKVICLYLERFSSLKELQDLFILIIENSLKICGSGLSQFYNSILVSTLTTFEQDPVENVKLLELMHKLMFYFEFSQEQQYWLEHNFSKFNQFIINLLDQTKNGAIISKWIDVLCRVYQFHPDFFFSLPELETVLVLLLKLFYEPQGPDLLKKLVQILNSFIGTTSTIQNPVVSQYLPRILEVTFQKLSEIESHRVAFISPLVLSVISGIEQQDILVNLFLTALNSDVYNNLLSQDQKKLFLEAIYSYRDNPKVFNALLKSLSEYVQNPTENAHSLNYIHEKLAEKHA